MAEQIENFQCPACMGPLHYVGASGKLECDYCGSQYDVSEIENLYQQKEASAEAAFTQEGAWDDAPLEQWGQDSQGMKAYNCPSCGAELICEETTAATCCPYCGNPAVVPGQFSGGLKPNCIIPFQLSQEQAVTALRNFYKGKHFLPSCFSKENKIQEIRGVYVPFWLFDGEADADVRFTASNSRVFRRGDYEITETQHYAVHRAGTVPFAKIPVDASRKMPDAYMDAIEPFSYDKLQNFSTAFLPGFLADKYDVSPEECSQRADARAANSAVDAMRQDVQGYDLCTVQQKTVKLRRGQQRYALLPVYLLGSKWQGKDYLFAMNGQTGRFVGELPVDWKKFWLWFGGLTAGITLALGSLLMLLL